MSIRTSISTPLAVICNRCAQYCCQQLLASFNTIRYATSLTDAILFGISIGWQLLLNVSELRPTGNCSGSSYRRQGNPPFPDTLQTSILIKFRCLDFSSYSPYSILTKFVDQQTLLHSPKTTRLFVGLSGLFKDI